MTKQQIQQAILIIFAIVAFTLFYIKQEVIVAQGKSLIMPVTGYDPRDLVAGYYLLYQVDYGAPVCQNITGEACVCVIANNKGAYKAEKTVQCRSQPPDCPTFIRGTCAENRFKAGIERYYIPEDKRHHVPIIPTGSTISLKVSAKGKAITTGFNVPTKDKSGMISLEEYLTKASQN